MGEMNAYRVLLEYDHLEDSQEDNMDLKGK
jgi:hypothetical protein